MEPMKFSLCPEGENCPEVEITTTDQGVSIRRDANTVRLSRAAWNELVWLIETGRLGTV